MGVNFSEFFIHCIGATPSRGASRYYRLLHFSFFLYIHLNGCFSHSFPSCKPYTNTARKRLLQFQKWYKTRLNSSLSPDVILETFCMTDEACYVYVINSDFLKYVWKISVRWPVQVKHSFGLIVCLGENPNKKYTECVKSILIYYSEYVNVMWYFTVVKY
jgi:hypothetical protein